MKAKSVDAGIPCAWISFDGGRKKIYDDKFVYLKDGQVFEIELKNPTSTTYLAKIKLNGKHTSQTGIVLRPGEKTVLKRYLDSDNAFLFKTYNVDKDDVQIDAVIAQNGLLEVEFYAEMLIVPKIQHVYYPIQSIPYYQPTIYYHNGSTYGNINLTGGSAFTTSNSSVIGTTTGLNVNSSNTANVNLNNIVNHSHEPVKSKDETKDETKEETKETGTVEKGSKTDQEFRTVNNMFNSYLSYSTKYQILPESEKPIIIDEIKIYCSDCGKKCKHKENFCSKCGHKLNS